MTGRCGPGVETELAIKPADNESFYREVDDELRRAQLTGFWKRYGLLMIGGAVLLLAAIGGVIYWQSWREARAGAQSEKLASVLQQIQYGRVKEVGPQLDQLARDGDDGVRVAALLAKAGIAAGRGDDKAAVAGYKAIADDDGLAPPYRDLALVRETAIAFDGLPPATVIARLGPLAKPGNAWFGSAGEMVGIAYVRQGKPALAGPIFAGIAKDESLPQSLRARAVQMAGSLGVDAIAPSEFTGDAAATTRESK